MEIHSEPVILYVISKTLKFIKHIMKCKSLAQVESWISIEFSANSRAGWFFLCFCIILDKPWSVAWNSCRAMTVTGAGTPFLGVFCSNPSLAGGRCLCWKCGRKLTVTWRYFLRTFMGHVYLCMNKGFLLMWLLSGL